MGDLLEQSLLGATGPMPRVMATQLGHQLPLLIGNANAMAQLPGVALTLHPDPPLRESMQLQRWVCGGGLLLAGLAGQCLAGQQGPGLEAAGGRRQPVGAFAVAQAGVQSRQLVIQRSIAPAAPGPFEALQRSAGDF